MKKIHIIFIVVIAVGLAMIVSTISNSSTYATLGVAKSNAGHIYHVVGKLDRSKSFMYNPRENANLFGFYLLDKEGSEVKVLYNGAMPQDFERSEQIVVVGKISGEDFHASQILMKCPSKYNGNDTDKMKTIGAASL